MVKLEDKTYAELASRAQMTGALEAEIARIIAEKDKDIARVKAEMQSEHARLNSALQAENQLLRDKLGLLVRRVYCASSERKIAGQRTFLFNEVELEAEPGAPEPLKEVKAYVRGKKKTGQQALLLSGLEIREVKRELPEDEQVCSVCCGTLHKIKESPRTKVEFAPLIITVVVEQQAKYCCDDCLKNTGKTRIVSAPLPKTAFPKSLASPSAVAYIMYEKYVQSCPLYRLEEHLKNSGLPLSRQTMSNWVLQGASMLDQIYLRMHSRLVKNDILHADETRVQVLKETQRDAEQQSTMWLYRTGRYSAMPVVLFDYQTTRQRIHPDAFLKDFTGNLHVDAYVGYEDIPGVTLCGCWAHARRYFFQALCMLTKDLRKRGGTVSHKGLAFCDELFRIERELHDLTPEERKIQREIRSRPVLVAFKTWLDKNIIGAIPQSKLAKAMAYCLNQWHKLKNFLLDGRIEIDNNRAERTIKSFVIGRKNWLFSKTPDGADASATIYSIIETAKENGLNPFKYLVFLFEQLPNINRSSTKQLDSLLPWSKLAQAGCKAPNQITILTSQ